MAFNRKEQAVYERFTELDILSPDYIGAFCDFCHNVYDRDYNNRKPLLKLAAKAKNEVYETLFKAQAHPGNEELAARLRDCSEAFKQILKVEAQHKQFDSYCLYLEIKRNPKDKFYQPRRMVLRKHGVIQAFQQLIDDELDILTISMPPGTAKASRLTSKVLTPTGFKLMKDIHVGDTVIAGNGKQSTVIGVYPQGKKPCYRLTLVDGKSTEISGDHLWLVGKETRNSLKTEIQTTDYIRERLHDYLIPVFDVELNRLGSYVEIDSIEYIGEEECQCIMIDDPCHLYITDDYIITHNTTSEKFFHSAVIGWYPDDYSLFYSHSGDITRMYYDSVYDLVTNDDEYTWSEIFPNLKVTGTNAKIEQFNVGKYKPFQSVQAQPLYSKVLTLDGFKRMGDIQVGDEVIAGNGNKAHVVGIYPHGAKEIYEITLETGEKCKCSREHLWYVRDIDTHETSVVKTRKIEKSFELGDRYEIPIYKDGKQHWSMVDSCLYVGKEECQCIAVDDPCHLYITDDYIVTHNCTSVGSKNAGKVRVSPHGFLFVDDMIGSIEEALNKAHLEKLWNAYSVDAKQRKMPGAKEVHIATRWSVADVIGRIQEAYEGHERVKFISVPAVNPETGESNFMYDIDPFPVEFFKNIELTMDDVSYRCLYMQDPVEREGLLYKEEELRRYVDLPDREPDAVLGICDTKEKGIDYMFLPVVYKYDNDYYLEDCICDDNSDFGVQYGRLTDIIIRHKMQQCEFESNQGGSRIAFEVQDRVKKQGGICNITTKPTETNKETRIIVNSDWVKQNVLFKNKTEYMPKSDYGRMMSFLLGYSIAGKNKHDDVPDGMANLALYVSRKLNRHETRIIKSPI